MIDPSVVLKIGEATDEYISELRGRIDDLERQLYFAAGVISTVPPWTDKHPQEVLTWIKTNSQKVDMKMFD